MIKLQYPSSLKSYIYNTIASSVEDGKEIQLKLKYNKNKLDYQLKLDRHPGFDPKNNVPKTGFWYIFFEELRNTNKQLFNLPLI